MKRRQIGLQFIGYKLQIISPKIIEKKKEEILVDIHKPGLNNILCYLKIKHATRPRYI